ncbi:MAG: radical SAM family heme chaperone HemW, partial [Candidatus Firestonebacteria bacterium]
VFIGGGTPTVLPYSELQRVLTGIFEMSDVLKDAEFTVEANPCTITVAKLNMMKKAGVNRLSIGMQSANDKILTLFGRPHNYKEFLKSYKIARSTGFNNINIDLIFGAPGQTLSGLRKDLEEAVSLQPEHISIYNLIFEEGTILNEEVKKGVLKALPEELEADMYYFIKDYLEKAGYKHYEISNFAKQGKECEHNKRYWKNEDYIGVGAGASGKIGLNRTKNNEGVNQYIVLIKDIKNDILHNQKISKEAEISETVFLALRMLEGLNLTRFKEKFGKDFFILFEKEYGRLLDSKLLKEENGSVKLTRTGLFLSNEVFVEFV